MIQLKIWFKNKLRDLEGNFTELTQNPIDLRIAYLLYIGTRIQMMFPNDQFCSKPYQDAKLKLFKDMINWIPLITPVNSIDNNILKLVVVIVMSFIHWLILFLIFSNFNGSRTFVKQYFLYFQVAVLYGSFAQINNLLVIQEYQRYSAPFIIPLIISQCLYTYFFRNYQLPSVNPYARRYKVGNFITSFIEIICLICLPYFSEGVQIFIQLFLFFTQMLDSIVFQPYEYNINLKYSGASGSFTFLLFFKAIMYFLDVKQFFYISLLFIPLLTCLLINQLKDIYKKNLYNQKMTIKLMYLAADYNQNSNQIFKFQIFKSIKEKLQINLEFTNLNEYLDYYFSKVYENQFWYQNEQLFLYKINFYISDNDKIRFAYMELKKFRAYQYPSSIFLNYLEENLCLDMQQRDEKKIIKSQGDEASNVLEPNQVRFSEELLIESVPIIQNILEYKLHYWGALLQGYETIELFAEESINLSKRIGNLKNSIFSQLKIDIDNILRQINKLNVLDLKLLSLLFSVVFNDFYYTQQIEKRINEVLSQEKYSTRKQIINTTLLNDECIILSMSAVKQFGQLLYFNKQLISKFFQIKGQEQVLSIVDLKDLLPDYLKTRHDGFVLKFLASADSELFITSKEVYASYQSGFLFRASLQLTNSYNLQVSDDLILTAAIKKESVNSEYILFDESGKILGITESIQQILIQSDFDDFDKQLLKSYIFYWFHSLFEMIVVQHEQYFSYTNQISVNSQTSFVRQVLNLDQIIKEHEQHKQQNYLKQTSTNRSNLQDMSSYSNTDRISYSKDCLQQTQDFLRNSSIKKYQTTICHEVFYNLSSHFLAHKYLIYILTVTEYNKRNYIPQSSAALSSFKQTITHYQQSSSTYQTPDNPDTLDFLDEPFQDVHIQPTVFNKILHFNPHPHEFKVDLSQGGGELFYHLDLKVFDNQKSGYQSNLISPKDEREVKNLIEDEEEDFKEQEQQPVEFAKSSSQKDIRPNDFIELVMKDKKIQNLQQQIQRSQQSNTTSDKTYDYISTTMRRLQHTHQYQSYIVKVLASAITFVLIVIIVQIVELIQVRQNTNTLQFQIPLVRLPQKFHRLYCTYSFLSQIQLISIAFNQSYGTYQEYVFLNQSYIKRLDMQSLVNDIEDQFAGFQQDSSMNSIQAVSINEYYYDQFSTTMIQFDQMINERIQLIDVNMQAGISQNQEELIILLEFLKGNINSQISLTNSIVKTIQINFYQQIDDYKLQYLCFFLSVLVIITIALILQQTQWKKPFRFMQIVLILISRMSETAIQDQCSRLLFIKDNLASDTFQWKKFSLLREFFLHGNSSQYSHSQNSVLHRIKNAQDIKNQKTTNRIKETRFSIGSIYLLVVILWIFLSGYAMSVYLILFFNLDDAKPELYLAMSFVQYKQDLDSLIILSFLLKTQQEIMNYSLEKQIYSKNSQLNTSSLYYDSLMKQLIFQFQELKSEAEDIYSNLYNNVMESSKMGIEKKTYLLNLYSNDLCEVVPELLPFCNYTQGKFHYFPTYPQANDKDDNRMEYKYGLNGIYQQISNIFDTRYQQELLGYNDPNNTASQQFIYSSEFIQLILPYYFEIAQVLLEFYYTIIYAALDILDVDFRLIIIYQTTVGITCLGIYLLAIFIKAYFLQQKVKLVRQALVMIPHESQYDHFVLQIIKQIETSM